MSSADEPQAGQDRPTVLRKIGRSLLDLPRSLKRSILRHGYPDSDRDRSLVVTSNLLLHIHSVHTHENSLRFTYTFGLGLITLFLFIILCVTGIILMFFYVPSVTEAYDRIRDLKYVVSGGMLVRNLHRWSAHGMVIAAFLHMSRVFYTASYRRPREFNWLVGLALLVLTLALSFTGYLLPWDQLAFWATTIGANIANSPQEVTDALGITGAFDPGGMLKRLLLGGNQVGQDALLRFYVLHCLLLPGLAVYGVALHMWRIRKDGGLSRPASADEPRDPAGAVETLKTYSLMALPKVATPQLDKLPERAVMTWPHLVLAEAALFMLVLAGMMVLSLVFDAPLRQLADPQMPENPAKAPWYFLGLQELVSYSAFAGGVGIPALVLLGLGLMPYLDDETESTGLWFSRPRGGRVALLSALVAAVFVVALLAFTVRHGWLRSWYPGIPQLVIVAFNPGTLITAMFAAGSLLVAKRTRSVRLAAIALYSMFLVGFVILTIMGTYFRGPNWDFYWSPAAWPGAH